MGFSLFALLLPQSAETRSGAEFPGLGALLLGDFHGFLEAGFGYLAADFPLRLPGVVTCP